MPTYKKGRMDKWRVHRHQLATPMRQSRIHLECLVRIMKLLHSLTDVFVSKFGYIHHALAIFSIPEKCLSFVFNKLSQFMEASATM